MAWPTWTVEVAWSTELAGVIRIGYSTIGGTDTIPGAFGDEAYEAITSDVQSVQIRRGRTSDLAQLMAASCTVTLKDTIGKYNPANSSSSLAPNLVPMRPVRVKATVGASTYELFTGYIQKISSDQQDGHQEGSIEAADFFSWLSAYKPTIASTGRQTRAPRSD